MLLRGSHLFCSISDTGDPTAGQEFYDGNTGNDRRSGCDYRPASSPEYDNYGRAPSAACSSRKPYASNPAKNHDRSGTTQHYAPGTTHSDPRRFQRALDGRRSCPDRARASTERGHCASSSCSGQRNVRPAAIGSLSTTQFHARIFLSGSVLQPRGPHNWHNRRGYHGHYWRNNHDHDDGNDGRHNGHNRWHNGDHVRHNEHDRHCHYDNRNDAEQFLRKEQRLQRGFILNSTDFRF